MTQIFLEGESPTLRKWGILFKINLLKNVSTSRKRDENSQWNNREKNQWFKIKKLTLSWRRPLSYRFLYDNGLRHERVKENWTRAKNFEI